VWTNLIKHTGRDRIDHPQGAHDDIANAVAGALDLASGKSEPGWISYAREMVTGVSRTAGSGGG
jgi:hypothetical protein